MAAPSTSLRRLARAGRIYALVLVGSLAWSGAGGAQPLRFPSPDRPVASDLSPAYADEKGRDKKGEAEKVMGLLGIRAGIRVADVGAGDGYYTVRLAKRLGPKAVIYAQDVSRRYLDRLRARLEREKIGGVRLVLGTPNDPRLPPKSVDVAILSHMYHEIANPYEFLYRLRPALAPGARVGIIELDRPTQGHGTPPALLRCELGAVGYREKKMIALAPADGYLMIAAPPGALPRADSIKACKG